MSVSITFYTLSGPFKRVKTQSFASASAAVEAVKAYAEPAGFTNIKLIDGEEPYDGFRITGKTPGGRRGRNLAMGDWEDETGPVEEADHGAPNRNGV